MRFFRDGVQRARPVLALVAAALLLLGAQVAHAQALSTYSFSAGTGTQNSMAGASTIYGTGVDDGVSGAYSIGFTFVFNGTNYTQFWASSNGYIGLGSGSPGSYLSGSFQSASFAAPVIAALWRDLHTGNDGYVQYLTTGSIGSRVLTVEWKVRDYPGSGQPTNTTFQIRLYEGSNRFDIWYGNVTTAGGTVGAWISNSNFASISPATNTVSYVTSNGSAVPPSGINRMFAFDLCTISISGNVAQGGTAAMASFDSLMTGISVMRGSSGNYTPYTITPSGCAPSANLTYTISGAAAADYSISPTNPSVTPGNTSVPTITFSPSATGKRVAVLTVSGPSSFLRTYYLAATGAPRLAYTGNVPQGGTSTMKNGDTLLGNISIKRYATVNLTPFMLTNISPNVEAPAAPVTYSIRGFSGGQYSISPSNAALTAGQSNTPVLTFHPTSIGTVLDTLVVNADGEIRVFPLRAFSEAPGIQAVINGRILDSNSQLFRNEYSCMGGSFVTYAMQVTNVGADTLRLYGYDVFATDTTYQQGTPRYPLLRDQYNEGFLEREDYVLTLAPPVLPTTSPKNAITWPVEIQRNQTRTVYLSFNAQRRDKRFARLYLHTNGQNIANFDPYQNVVEGLLWFDMFGRGNGGRLSDVGGTAAPKGVLFPNTRIDGSSTATYTLYNSGECDLRVSLRDMRFTSGDVEEFTIETMPTGTVDAATGDLIITPGASVPMTVRFQPHQQGSRRASLRVQTNDSMQVVEGIVDRGLYYVDFYGMGEPGLYMQGHDFGQVLIGGDASEQHRGTVELENIRETPLEIVKLEIDGVDKGEYAQDASAPWPTLPDTLEPGEKLTLSVVFAPVAGGSTGNRTGIVRATTGSGDIVIGNLTGRAGTRTIAVGPPSLNFGTVTSGKVVRQMAMITNTGTMPLTLGTPSVSVATDFYLGSLPRVELIPGQTEYLEVSYAPTSAGVISGTLDVPSNATNGTQQVQLAGTAVRTRGRNDDPAVAIRGNGSVGNGLEVFSVAGVSGVRDASGMALMQSVPNPARDLVEIAYTLPVRGAMTLALYDGNGRLVRMLDEGTREAGQTTLRVNVSGLANGVYHYRLMSNGHALDRTLTVAR